MTDNIKIEQRVLDGDLVGPVTAEIDTKEFTGTVELENSLLDGSGSEINVELSESMEVVGIDDLVEVKSEIDKSVNKVEASVQQTQKQIDKANETIRKLDAISGQITNLVDTAKQAATTADNRAHNAQASESNAASSASDALASEDAAKISETNAKASENAAKASQSAAKSSENMSTQKAAESKAQADRAQQEANAAANSAVVADREQQAALAAQKAAEKARDEAKASENQAGTHAGNAYNSQQAAKTSETKAKTSETKAKASEVAAAASASSMTQSVADAEAARNAAQQAQSDAEDARDVASGKATLATQKAEAASTSASAAAASQQLAKQNADSATDSETKAKASENAAKASQTAAASSAASALVSKNAAAASQSAAKTSQDAAKVSETHATDSETKAKASENAAKASQTAAASSAADAARSKQLVQTAKADVDQSVQDIQALTSTATTAKDDAVAAKTAAVAAQNAAKASENKAKASESAAASSATRADQSKTAAANSASQAAASKTAAGASANAAKASANNSADSALGAAKSASDASASEMEAGKQATAAKAAQTAAKTSENKSAASASQANTSATNAAASAKAASDSAKEAATLATNAADSAQQSSTSASEAQASAVDSKKHRDEAESFAVELRKGSVYRGTWNPNSGKYPSEPTTNAKWDVQLNTGQLEKVFDGKTWNWGDRLVYILDTKKFDIIESGTGVVSVNGDTGAVTVTPENIGAARKSGEVFTGDITVKQATRDAKLSVISAINKDAEFSLTEEGGDQVHGTYINYQGSSSNETHYGTIRGGNKIPFMVTHRGQNFPHFVGVPRVNVAQPSAGDSLTRKDWIEDNFLSKSGGSLSGNLLTTGYYRANNFQLSSLNTNTKYTLRGSSDTLTVGNGDLGTINILGTVLKHNGAVVYTETNKPTAYDVQAVAQGEGWAKYTRRYSVNKDTPAVLLNLEGKPLDMTDTSYYIRAYTRATSSSTGSVFYIKGANKAGASTDSARITTVASVGSGSNHPVVYLDNGVLKLKTSHTNLYEISVIIEEVDNDANPWLDIVQAYSPSNKPNWDDIRNTPTQAKRWPKFSEVTEKPSAFPTTWDNVANKPAQATRWPSWAEVGGNSYLTRDSNGYTTPRGWFKAFSDATGFLPSESGTAGKSNIGTSSWWFKNAFIANIYARYLNIKNGMKVEDGGIHVVSNNGANGLKISRYTNPAVEYMNISREDTTTYFDSFEDESEADTVFGGFSFRGGQKGVDNNRLTELLFFSNQSLRYKGQDIYHKGNKPTPADIGALPANAAATNSTHLEGKTLDQVIAEARTGYATTDYAYSKAFSDARFFRKGQDVRIDKAGDGTLSLDVGTNRDAGFYITEDSKKHGTYIRYAGSGNNYTYFGTVSDSAEKNYMQVPRGSDQVYFVGNPRSLAPQATNGDALTKYSWVYEELSKKLDATKLDNLVKGGNNVLHVNSSYGTTKIGMNNSNYCHFYTDATAGFYFDKGIFVKGDITPHDHQTTRMRHDNGQIEELGQRVYSPNNKPKLADLAQPDSVTKNLKLVANTWTTLLDKSNFKDGSGVYQIIVSYSSASQGGGAYSQNYTGQLYWYANNTNQDNVSEIPLHHMGTADGGEYIYLRTHTKPGNKGDHTVEIKCNKAFASSVRFTIKLVKIM